jgi:ribosomal protein S26
MSEDYTTLTCRHCGTSVPTDQAVDVETPVGPVSICFPCSIITGGHMPGLEDDPDD